MFDVDDLVAECRAAVAQGDPLRSIKEVLERVRWNRAETARLLKISYKALLYKIRQCGLDGPRPDGHGK